MLTSMAVRALAMELVMVDVKVVVELAMVDALEDAAEAVAIFAR